MTVKKFLLLSTLSLLFIPAFGNGYTPRVTIIATGGTIAGIAPSSAGTFYDPAQLTVGALMEQVPEIRSKASITGIQLCNIASQHMTTEIWIRLASVIDSLFSNDLCDGIVVTHGTDTMEETAFFLNLVVPHDKPVVLTGSMRPSNVLGADGPANLYNAVCLAASPAARDKGVMAVMNDNIFAAAEFTKTHTVNPHAFESPGRGPLGIIRGGIPVFFRDPGPMHTVHSEFSIKHLHGTDLPPVGIVLSYAGASAVPVEALIASGVEGIVVAGVGHGNYSLEIEAAIPGIIARGVLIVRATRILCGGVASDVESPFEGQLTSGLLSPQKVRILLMVALTRYRDPDNLQRIIDGYQ